MLQPVVVFNFGRGGIFIRQRGGQSGVCFCIDFRLARRAAL
jgi:hypothetical protein